MHIKKLIPLIIILALFGSGCSSAFQSQLQFGIYAAQKNLWDEAIFRWKKVVGSEPNSASAHNNLAVAYEQKGLWKEAESEYKLALKLSPNHEYIQSNYTKFKRNLENLEDEEKNEKKR